MIDGNRVGSFALCVAFTAIAVAACHTGGFSGGMSFMFFGSFAGFFAFDTCAKNPVSKGKSRAIRPGCERD